MNCISILFKTKQVVSPWLINNVLNFYVGLGPIDKYRATKGLVVCFAIRIEGKKGIMRDLE